MSWTKDEEAVSLPKDIPPPTINPITYVSTTNQTISGKAEPDAIVELFIDGELNDLSDVSSDGSWSQILDTIEDGNDAVDITVKQKKTFNPPDDGTVGAPITKTSALSSPQKVQFLPSPSITNLKQNMFIVETSEFNAEGKGTSGCKVTLYKPSFGSWSSIEDAETEVESDGTWKMCIPPGSDGSFEHGAVEVRAIQQWCTETENVQSEPSSTIKFTVETSHEHMVRMQSSHNKEAKQMTEEAVGKALDDDRGNSNGVDAVDLIEMKPKMTFKKAYRKVAMSQSVWATPSRAVLDRERREREHSEAERLERERIAKEDAERVRREAEEKARKIAAYEKSANEQARRIQQLEDERLERLEENRKKMKAAKGGRNSLAPSAPATSSSSQRSSLFRRSKKPMSTQDLSSLLLSASMEVFGVEDPKTALIPSSITVTGFPNRIPKKEPTEPVAASRIGQWTF